MIRGGRFLLGLAVLVGAAEAAERAKAQVVCVPTAITLVYDCTIRLTSAATGAPLTGVDIAVGADMPSMPLAHNVRPVRAVAGPTPGAYTLRLELPMRGEWALRLRLSGPVRDQLVTHLTFTSTEVTPTPPSAAGSRPRH